MKKAVAIPYIIALIIGIIVVAVLAYWFVSSSNKGTRVGNEAECVARKTEYCVTQTADAKSAANKVCSSGWDSNLADYCGRIIPGWSEIK